MELFDVHHPMVLVFGILGNIISAGVYFAPLPTFMEICKRKSTMGFQSLPYVVSLFSALLWLFYALIKGSDTFLLISINTLGTFIESIYIIIFLVYATPDTKKQTFKSLTAVMMLCLVISLGTYFPFKEQQTRVIVVGWVCVGVSVCVFAAPLSIVFQVVRTKSVEYMPLSLSCFLTLSAITWFAYGMSIKDTCVTVPNILGFVLGVIQMGLYAYYSKRATSGSQEKKGKVKEHIINITMLSNSEVVKMDVPMTDEVARVKQMDQMVKVDVPITDELAHVKQLDTGGVLVMCAAA
ncbi:senescence associated protein [Artemisia annua]|uniref:Bidirectional sugar transporter SWEET n=1 Tax=Artemisia annua TaxID=35608 RepID=A0A2U1PV66_ARTAN|nr:senescence associated protein [Artemisia annua]